MATSHLRQFNHIASPEELGITMTKGYNLEVEPLTLNDFRHAIRYYAYTCLTGDELNIEWKMENMFMECQGNLGAFHRSRDGYQDRPF